MSYHACDRCEHAEHGPTIYTCRHPLVQAGTYIIPKDSGTSAAAANCPKITGLNPCWTPAEPEPGQSCRCCNLREQNRRVGVKLLKAQATIELYRQRYGDLP
jgi:hypothetical protein